jgi:hypothetical protein
MSATKVLDRSVAIATVDDTTQGIRGHLSGRTARRQCRLHYLSFNNERNMPSILTLKVLEPYRGRELAAQG